MSIKVNVTDPRDVRRMAYVVDGKLQVGSSVQGGVPVSLADSASIDSFDRLRVSNPQGLFDSVLAYDKQPLLWNERLTGGATSVHRPNEASVRMTVTSSGDAVLRQSKQWTRYQPGKSQLIFATWVFGAGDPNVTKRIGYFSEENGIYLEEINGSLWIVTRTFSSGAVVETRVPQASWNLNTFSGIDITTTQILVIDFQWLGVGRVRVGFVIDGIVTYCHEFKNANLLSVVYMTSAQLPLALQIVATGAPAGATYMDGICGSVMSEGGQEEKAGYPFSARNVAAISVAASQVPLISIRPKLTFNSLRNVIQIIERETEVLNTGTGSCIVDILLNPTLTGASFTSVGADSVVERDISASSLTGGTRLRSFFVASSVQSKSSAQASLQGKITLGLDIPGTTSDILTVAATNIGTVDALAAINWQEYR